MNSQQILETELASLLNIHKPGVPEVINKLLDQVRKESQEEIIRFVDSCYYMDESGVEAMHPAEISSALREVFIEKVLASSEEKS
jgi:hypothetical protein